MNRSVLLGLLASMAAGAQSHAWIDTYAEESAAYLPLYSKMGLQIGAPKHNPPATPASASKLFATVPGVGNIFGDQVGLTPSKPTGRASATPPTASSSTAASTSSRTPAGT